MAPVSGIGTGDFAAIADGCRKDAMTVQQLIEALASFAP
jgi:hypothetical protein